MPGANQGSVSAFAPAKINLALHVTGRRADGYHTLESIVVFADIGDRVTARADAALSLRVSGPMAGGVPEDGSNLVLKAARLLSERHGAALELEKHLPAASGIGGGSSDAAAALRVLSRLWDLPLPAPADVLALGADVPVCLAPAPVRMEGIGERLTPLPDLPPLWLVLANPRLDVPTQAVFRALERRDNPGLEPLPAGLDARATAEWLARQRNDLQGPALTLAPQIETVLHRIAALPGCLLSRMSGSGATCFGLFEAEEQARAAAGRFAQLEPGWWAAAGRVLPAGDQSTRATT